MNVILEYKGMFFEQDENGDYRKIGDDRAFSHVERAYQSWISRTSPPEDIEKYEQDDNEENK